MTEPNTKDLTPSNWQPFMLLKTFQAAEFAGTTARHFEDLRRSGTGPKFVRLSRKAVRYRLSDLIAWIESNIKSSTAEY